MVSLKVKDPQDVAFNVLWRIEKDKAFAAPVLNRLLSTSALNDKDRSFATQLVYGVIRWKLYLENIVSRYLFKPWKKTDLVTRLILIIGAYGILKTRKNPGYIVYRAVEQTKILRGEKMGALVNAILRRIAMDKELINREEITESMSVEEIAWRLSHPLWLFDELKTQYGLERAISLGKAHNMERRLTIRVTPHLISREELYRKLIEKYGRDKVTPADYSPLGIYIQSSGNVMNSNEYKEGLFTIQDEGSQIVTLLLQPGKNEYILDATAGRGIKTSLLASLEQDIKIDAVDKYPDKLRALKSEFKRQKLSSSLNCYSIDLEIGYGDIEDRKYDKILLDAPCTGSGTLRSKVELRYRLQKDDIEAMAEKQLLLLSNLAPLLKEGGRLVYIVCSLFNQERWEVVDRFIQNHPEFYIKPSKEILPELPDRFFDTRGALTLFPDLYKGEGFFAVVLIKGKG